MSFTICRTVWERCAIDGNWEAWDNDFFLKKEILLLCQFPVFRAKEWIAKSSQITHCCRYCFLDGILGNSIGSSEHVLGEIATPLFMSCIHLIFSVELCQVFSTALRHPKANHEKSKVCLGNIAVALALYHSCLHNTSEDFSHQARSLQGNSLPPCWVLN